MLGTVIGNYRIEAEIGRGGMGVVYRARHVNMDRMVAVKALLPQFASDQEVRRRLFQEQRILDGLRHANIVALHDVYVESNAVFLVMEYIEGETLERIILDDGAMTIHRVAAMGQQILAAWDQWDGDLELPERACHGDLKVSNIRMDTEGRYARCLIDLDTLGMMPLAVEMGDAWRSWCNPAPEDDFLAVRFDMEIFTATAQAWLAHAPAITKLELGSLVPGVERICLELAARFCADAVANCYFREDTSRFPQPGTQNLAKAKTQRALAAAARSHRSACEAVVQSGAQGRPIPG